MKKHIMLILSAILIAIPVFAQSGEDIDGVNYCTKVNRYDVSKVTSISFPDSSLYGSGSNYTLVLIRLLVLLNMQMEHLQTLMQVEL